MSKQLKKFRANKEQDMSEMIATAPRREKRKQNPKNSEWSSDPDDYLDDES